MRVGKRWSVSVAGSVVAGALAASGCSGGAEAAGGGDDSAGTRASASAVAVVAPLTVEQLRGLTFADGEVAGAHEGGVPVQEAQPAEEQRSFPPVSDPACQVVLDIRDGRGASAVVLQTFNWKGDIWGGGSTLAAYEDGEAERVFARLEQALGACRLYEGMGWTGQFEATLTRERAPRVGDEAVRFRETIPMEDEQPGDREEEFTVVRAGNAIVTFRKLDVGGDAAFPADLVDRQVERLRGAQGR